MSSSCVLSFTLVSTDCRKRLKLGSILNTHMFLQCTYILQCDNLIFHVHIITVRMRCSLCTYWACAQVWLPWKLPSHQIAGGGSKEGFHWLQNEVESPLTKTVRVTAALVLRNLCRMALSTHRYYMEHFSPALFLPLFSIYQDVSQSWSGAHSVWHNENEGNKVRINCHQGLSV